MENTKKLRTNYIFVDYENVQPSSFHLTKDFPFKVLIFVGANQTKIPIELATSMQRLGSNAEYIRIEGSGKNALDFHITFYLGKTIEKDHHGYFHIISKDTGFDILIKHLKEQKILINRYSEINDIPALKIVGTEKKPTINEQVNIIVDYLIRRGNAKPRKVETLANTIKSIFMKTLTQSELDKLIKSLVEKKYIIIKETKVHYTLK